VRRCAVLLVLVAAVSPCLATDPAKAKLKPGATGKVCLGCHVDFAEKIALPHVHTPVRAGDCADCHDPHASDHGKLLAAEPNEICIGCHAGIVPEGAKSAHDAVVAGQCTTCHDPHASTHPNNLREEGNALCLGCHKDLSQQVAGATHKHPPVEKSCLTCHSPHASKDAPALLARSVPALCVTCHDPRGAAFARGHSGYAVGGANCVSCHDPHGSSNDGLLWATVHPPVARRMCGQCHAEPGAAAGLTPRRSGSDLCRTCHAEVLNESLAKKHVHGPLLDDQACEHCHTPHASANAALLTEPPGELCGSCHTDAVQRHARSKSKHEPIAEGLCTTCHSPHGSDEPFLLAAPTTELCGACHDWKQHRAHPMGADVIDPRNRNLSVDCLSCHRAHGTPEDHLAFYEPRKELCMQCHTQFAP
jgi:predicted CXXCH cytochrome family protein